MVHASFHAQQQPFTRTVAIRGMALMVSQENKFLTGQPYSEQQQTEPGRHLERGQLIMQINRR
ncbi:hypothetical protein D3C77_250430 [compost metagenome]